MQAQSKILASALPWIRCATSALGVYKPLNSWWIGVLARRTGLVVRRYGNGTFELISRDRMIRYDNWDMAYFLALNFDYYFGAVEPATWRGYKLVDFSHSSWHRTLPGQELFFYNSLAEPESTTNVYLDAAGLRDGETVLDLGAYNGTQTVLFSRAVGPNGRVIALEPDPESHAALLLNLSFHNAVNVEAFNCGAWAHTGTLEFFADGSMGSSFLTPHIHGGRRIEVPVISVADIIDRCKLDRLDFVKMDIEGAEETVLNCMGDVLLKYRPKFVIEPHLIGSRSTLEPVVTQLRKFGYACEEVNQGVRDMPLILAHCVELSNN